jgi:hypothetical protein
MIIGTSEYSLHGTVDQGEPVERARKQPLDKLDIKSTYKEYPLMLNFSTELLRFQELLLEYSTYLNLFLSFISDTIKIDWFQKKYFHPH